MFITIISCRRTCRACEYSDVFHCAQWIAKDLNFFLCRLQRLIRLSGQGQLYRSEYFPDAQVIYCPPPFRRKVEGHCFWFSVVRGAWRVVRGAWFRVFSGYFFPLTPPTVSVQSFWNFTGVLRMVWRYACGFFQNPEIIFYHFFCIFNLDIFWVLILQKSIGSRYLVPLTPPTVFGWSFWNFTWAFRMAEDMHVVFSESWNNFLSLFPHF